ncbi:YceI family protein [Streptomyces sp. NPDC058295]|uniref:YceI family protein n=1 Tax=Streptomyces sp. NPDC058295 TaxID=3346431 RepID=UPI0036E72E10
MSRTGRPPRLLRRREPPEITFAARSAELRADETVQVSGQLPIRGISRPLSLTAHLVGVDADALTLDAVFAVDRAQFGMDWNLLGMIRGHAMITATLRSVRTAT